ncbi:ALG6, ALG8 glycosyltransferase family-domain-containing protein [Phlebopus sp. FC_14]|nr:ALG6, ALG8 glycosyltransferase family-domain-containing protein [Phlebopus sp. FC_14]
MDAKPASTQHTENLRRRARDRAASFNTLSSAKDLRSATLRHRGPSPGIRSASSGIEHPEILAPVPRRHLLQTSESLHWLKLDSFSDADWQTRGLSPVSATSSVASVLPASSSKRLSFSALMEQERLAREMRTSVLLRKEHEEDRGDIGAGRRWVRWMHRHGMKAWVVPTAIIASMWVKWCIGLGGYSGYATPPMFGDYEAQRHWMELTIHLPPREWYTYDLQYWGLDYPPLTAYASWLCGRVSMIVRRASGSLVHSSWFSLYTSRGIETPGSKVFMRASVLLLDALVYIPALYAFTRIWHGTRSLRTQQSALVTLLFHPALLLVDFGHFQYNSVMLGFSLLAMDAFAARLDLLGAIFFVLSLGFKQMALYYAPAIGAYLLGKCVYLGPVNGSGKQFIRIPTRLFVRLALVTLVSFLILFAPFLPPFAPIPTFVASISRIFPFSRGLFEDKVANFWCFTNVTVLKWKRVFEGKENFLVKASAALTTLGFLPAVAGLLWGGYKTRLSPLPHSKKQDDVAVASENLVTSANIPTPILPLLPYAMLTASMSFFLFSFQVHEKTILLPLLPLTLLLSGTTPGEEVFAWGVLGNIVGVFSMWPLLKKDGLGVQYIAMLLLWCRLVGHNPFRIRLNSFVSLLSTAAHVAMVLLHLLELVVTPPTRYPDLFHVLNVLISTPVFGLIWLWSIKRGIEVGWALGGLPGSGTEQATRKERNGRVPSVGSAHNLSTEGVRRDTGMRAMSLGYSSGQMAKAGYYRLTVDPNAVHWTCAGMLRNGPYVLVTRSAMALSGVGLAGKGFVQTYCHHQLATGTKSASDLSRNFLRTLELPFMPARIPYASLRRHIRTYVCRDKKGQNIILKDGSRAQILQNRVDPPYKVAPASTVDENGKPYKSGFPHEYGNAEGFEFLHEECRTLSGGRKRLEFPVIDTADKKKWFNPNLSKKEQDSGPYRMIYTATGEGAKAVKHEFCGVVVHIPPEDREFAWCALNTVGLVDTEEVVDIGEFVIVEKPVGIQDLVQEVLTLPTDVIPYPVWGGDQSDQSLARCKKANVDIPEAAAKAAYDRGIVKTGASGYPKVFENKEKIKFQFGMCSKKKIEVENLTLMEFPVFADGREYDYNSKAMLACDRDADFKPEPGSTRIIYAIKDGKTKELCGVVGKTLPNNSGPFERCDLQGEKFRGAKTILIIRRGRGDFWNSSSKDERCSQVHPLFCSGRKGLQFFPLFPNAVVVIDNRHNRDKAAATRIMASLNKLAIRGIRSFDDKQISVIEFFSPVTVIVGHNGSGKTTIIECLKYATTGDQPPNTRGGAFVHDPKMANEKEVKAQVKLRFHAANGTRMLVVRNLSVTVKKTGLTMKTLENILALADSNVDKGGKRGAISTKCAEIDAEIPHLLGVSKSVLENVIFCHQEDSYWPLAEPAALKKKFDDIFEATRYTKALDSIKALRKDRVADLKAEKERLESLSKEKAHADKLRSRISDLNNSITSKQLQYEQCKAEYEELVKNNARFYESATKFRELYVKVENLQQKKEHYQQELSDARESVQEIEGRRHSVCIYGVELMLAMSGSDEELQTRLRNFDENIAQQKQKRRRQESERQDLEDELAKARRTHVELVNEHGELAAEAKAQERRISEREELIRDISDKHNIKGYSHSPLEREKVTEFISRLGDLQRRQRAEYEKLQGESRAKNDEYNKKSRQLHTELESLKMQRGGARDQIKEKQTAISRAESSVEMMQGLASELRTLAGDIEEKKLRLEKIKGDIKAANFDERLSERAAKARSMEDKRDTLNTELRGLSLQADARARLDLKRAEMKSKKTEVKNIIEMSNAKFRKLVGTDARAETMEREIDRASREKDDEIADAESETAAANKALQTAETTLSQAKAQLKVKRDELKTLDKILRDATEGGIPLNDAIKDAQIEVADRRNETSNKAGMAQVYENLLKAGRAKKQCQACNRHMDDKELAVFEKYLKEQIKKTSPEALKEAAEDLKVWEEELERLQKCLPIQASRDRIKSAEIPTLEKQIKAVEAELPGASEKAEQAAQKLDEIKKDIRDVNSLKQQAATVSRNQSDIERLQREIANLEEELTATGSTKTADDVQTELEALSNEIRINERERQAIMTERDRQNSSLRTYESDLHAMEKEENNLSNQIRDKDLMEERIVTMTNEITALNVKLKVKIPVPSTLTVILFLSLLQELDAKLAEAQAPIDRLEQEHQRIQSELNAKIAEAQRASQEMNMSVDKLDNINRVVDRYVREKRARMLADCSEKIEHYEGEIQEFGIKIETVRENIARIDREINESGSSVSNLRDNIRIRKLAKDIAATQAEIDSYDMEAAAKAKRNFEDRYQVEKQRETEMQSKYAHIGGEISSHNETLKQVEKDLREYKDINKRYTDQLVKVKVGFSEGVHAVFTYPVQMSDMANNDLEKYAKALDNAIMKYHSLKMEEVNDTMRHLWNKTYQGTEQVVMTKDQVEMDMRGRCSAGQKMLASIIIRLALSDSFGQNCGILALDEPTNALDIENIDALAESLVEYGYFLRFRIINERKNHSNFQLIIITHDENFLRKLGQCDVMEYYW